MRIGYLIDTYHPAGGRDEIADSMDAMVEDWIDTLTHPMRSAEQFSVVDNLSRGRLFTTVSRGFLTDVSGQFGIPEERMLGRFLEGLEVWRRACAGKRFDFDGRHWQVRGGRLAPPPYQTGGWPIWVADSFEEAAREFGSHLVSAARFYIRHGLLRHADFPTEADATAESLAPHLVLGTPGHCVEQLQRAEEERGIDYLVLCCRVSTGPSLERTREQILRLGEEVVAPIHARHRGPEHPAIPAGCRN